MRVWRIASAAHAAFDGEGARRYGSRWTRKGLPVVFASATMSLAAHETIVHTEPGLQPVDLVALAIDCPAHRAPRGAIQLRPEDVEASEGGWGLGTGDWPSTVSSSR